MTNLINGDARHIALADESVQCIITSPPYWGLRDYGTATWQGGDPRCDHIEIRGTTRGGPNSTLTGGQDLEPHKGQYRDTCAKCGAVRIDSQIGLEAQPDCLGWATGQPCGSCYVCHIVAVMRECWRVLRSDGVVFLNLGDSYASNPSSGGQQSSKMTGGEHKRTPQDIKYQRPAGLKPKDLCMIPARVALALQAAGWWVRSEIVWHKSNPMPESVTDRPTKAHEMIYLLTKRAEYYYDAEAIREASDRPDLVGKATRNYGGGDERAKQTRMKGHPNGRGDLGRSGIEYCNPSGRNRRSVWTVATQPYAGAHYAVFPLALIEPMILAGTSQRGACPTCGKAWRRVVELGKVTSKGGSENGIRPSGNPVTDFKGGAMNCGEFVGHEHNTLGFAPACACYGEAAPPLPAEPADTSNGDMAVYKAERARLLNDVYPLLPVVPCKVFDPFVGSGTVLRVAIKHSRIGIGNDLNLNYAPLAVDRTSSIQRVMPL